MMTGHDDAPEEELQDQIDIDFEAEDELGDLGAAKLKLKKLKDELVKVKLERQEYLDGWQRCKADSINARKEALANAERSIARSKDAFVEDLIPALDGFDMATNGSAWATLDPQWRNGIEQIRNQLLDVLSRNGVERFGAIGDGVDHVLHEVLEEQESAESKSGRILRIQRYGYKVNGRVLRPAHVVVSK